MFFGLCKWSLPVLAALVLIGYVATMNEATEISRTRIADKRARNVVVRIMDEVWTMRSYAYCATGLFFLAYIWMVCIARRAARMADDLENVTSFALHSSRSPLARINKDATLAMRGEMDPHEALKAIAQASEARLKAIEEYENISRGFAGYTKETAEEFDLVELADDILGYICAGTKGIDFRRDFPSEPLKVRAHRTLLAELMGNLLDNAVKYTKEGVVSFAISPLPKGVRIVVADTGRGMTKETRRRMYDRFFRAAETKDVPGNGLGLATVAAIVKRYRGKITCDSTLGKGTTFTVSLTLT